MRQQRIELIDFARGIALIAMTIFHFGFDLQLLGFKEAGYIDQAHWKYFARAIASSFLFLVGFSFYLSHAGKVRWQSWRMRMLKIIAAALLITIATYFATPEQYIFFGILHAIAFASLLCLAFLKLPWLLTAIIAAGVLYMGQYGRSEIFDDWYWYWTGLSQARPLSSDFVPIFPWMAAPLLGLAFAKFAERRQWLSVMAQPQLNIFPASQIKFIGRNSLIYYLLHQPIMLGLMVSTSWLMGWLSFN